MERLVTLCVMLLASAIGANAQANLSIGVFFNDDYAFADDSKMVWVEGKELEAYNLTLYRSITTENKQAIGDMEKAVTTDSRKAADKEMGKIGQRLYYAFLSFPPDNKHSNVRRYVFYRNAALRKGSKKDATLVYMEGRVSMEEIKKLFR